MILPEFKTKDEWWAFGLQHWPWLRWFTRPVVTAIAAIYGFYLNVRGVPR